MMLTWVKWNNVGILGFQGKNPNPGEIYYSLQRFFLSSEQQIYQHTFVNFPCNWANDVFSGKKTEHWTTGIWLVMESSLPQLQATNQVYSLAYGENMNTKERKHCYFILNRTEANRSSKISKHRIMKMIFCLFVFEKVRLHWN